jgi:hypothetical protein
MSGIPTSGGAGDVKLAGNPNTFTGTNTFNDNRPTSTLTDAPTDTEFITKQDADGDYALLAGGSAANNQEFIGFNTFTKDLTIEGGASSATRADLVMLGSFGYMLQSATTENKINQNGGTNEIDQNGTNNTISQSGVNSLITTSGKMTCATAPSGGSDLCNKTYVDNQLRLHRVTTAANFAANPVISYAVGLGNPTSISGGDNLDGRMDTPDANLTIDVVVPVITGAISETGKVKIDFCVVGEWSNISWDKGLILARAEQQADGSFPYNALIRAQTDPATPANGRYLVPFVQSYGAGQDYGSTMEQAVGFVVDVVPAGKTYRYTPVLINTSATGTFKLNRTINSNNYPSEERTISSIVATILNV